MEEAQQQYYIFQWGDKYYGGIYPTGRMIWTREISSARMLTQEDVEILKASLTGGPLTLYAVELKRCDML
ncbi:hypothetical protein [uncultured Duncaniella sp.]|uniref:hypothetical protein n=1 Tax=uncultured Duncaniella sp. TaxID=2768039 RepID=UPI002607919C|nr:hypothetical protein [uncultured Duncaniella sp.]